METLRFLMVTSFYPPYHLGGDAVHVQYLAEALAARGHEVHVEFSPAAYRLKRRGRPPAEAGSRGIVLHPIPSPFGRAQPAAAYLTGRSQGVSRFHADLQRELRPDVVHLHNISLLGTGLLPSARGALTLYTAHDYWLRCPRSDLLKYGRRPCETPTCVSCCLASGRVPQVWRSWDGGRGPWAIDLAIAPSRFMARAIGPYLACPVLHLPNFAPDPNPAGVLSEPEDYFLYVGALELGKGVDRLAAAARRSGFRVRFVGRGSYTATLQYLRDRGASNIEVDGWMTRAQLQPLYERARALVVPSTCQENAPLAALEALAWGTPLLVSQRGGLQEILHEGAAGRSFEPTEERLDAAVRRFEEDDLSHRLRSSARGAYEEHHRTDAYVDRYLAAARDPDGLSRALPAERDRAAEVAPPIAAPGGVPP